MQLFLSRVFTGPRQPKMDMHKAKQLIKQYWQLSRNYSQAYLIAQLLVFCGTGVEMLSGLVILGTGDTLTGNLNFIVKGLLDSLLFLALTHYLLRGYLKTQIVPRNINFKRGLSLCLMLLMLAAVHVGMTLAIDTSELLGLPSTENITVTIDGKEREFDIDSPVIWAVAVMNKFIFFMIWSLGYIFWHSTRSKRELQKQMEAVRFQQLTNQLNPHFLFNTLNSIRALIFEDKDKAADLVTQLSELFRTHLQAHLKPVASLDEECRIAQQYLDIEKVRMEERMQVSFNIDEELMQQKLPTLTVLTLIENAVKHGITPNPEKGYISLRARKLNYLNWQLEITNSYARQSTSKSTGTGLKNTRQRLKLMFADESNLRIEDQQNSYRVIMELPYV